MNINQKIYTAIQKGLNEALTNLSIDDFDDVETEQNVNNNMSIDREDQVTVFLFDRFVRNNDAPLRSNDKKIIEEINSNPNLHVGYVKATDDNIKNIVNRAIKILGEKANLNWIDVSRVTNMELLFYTVQKFTGNLSELLEGTKFNGDISRWDTSSVRDMSQMFYHSSFNGDISNWDVSNVEKMDHMFANSKFNKDISNWDVSNVTNMSEMFRSSQFNGDISKWDVSHVLTMERMFQNSIFNGDISNWDVSGVWDTEYMFLESKFDNDISKWELNMDFRSRKGMFDYCPIRQEYKPEFK